MPEQVTRIVLIFAMIAVYFGIFTIIKYDFSGRISGKAKILMKALSLMLLFVALFGIAAILIS